MRALQGGKERQNFCRVPCNTVPIYRIEEEGVRKFVELGLKGWWCCRSNLRRLLWGMFTYAGQKLVDVYRRMGEEMGMRMVKVFKSAISFQY